MVLAGAFLMSNSHQIDEEAYRVLVETDVVKVVCKENDQSSAALPSRNSESIPPSATVANDYIVDRIVGSGGMCVVYKAQHRSSGETVALKVLKSERVRDKDTVGRTMREAAALTRFFHKNIGKVHTVVNDEHYGPVIVMEFIEGVPVTSYLSTANGKHQDQAIKLCLQVCEALEYSHAHGIVHRDIKPANVLVTNDGTAKLIDFGIARLLEEDGKHTPLTQTNEMMGTSGYMSPEQCFGQAADVRSDVYQVGCLLYELLAGKPPFAGTTSFDVMYKHVSEELDLSAIDANIRDVIRRAVSKNPEDRYDSIVALRHALLFGQPTTQAQPDKRPQISRKRITRFAIPATVLLIISTHAYLSAHIPLIPLANFNPLTELLFPVDYLKAQTWFCHDDKRIEQLCERAYKLAPHDSRFAEEWSALAQHHYYDKQYSAAIKAYKRACALLETASQPTSTDQADRANLWLGVCRSYLGLGDAKEAIAAAQKAISVWDGEYEYWEALGDAFVMDAQYKAAITAFQKAQSWDALAKLYVKLGNLELAEDAASMFISANAKDPDAASLTLYADILAKRNKVKRAEEFYNKSLKLDLNQKEAWKGLSSVLKKQRKLEESLAAERKSEFVH